MTNDQLAKAEKFLAWAKAQATINARLSGGRAKKFDLVAEIHKAGLDYPKLVACIVRVMRSEARLNALTGLAVLLGLTLFLASVATLAARWDAVLTFGVR